MGVWAAKPWDNDDAADWNADLFEKTNLRAAIIEELNKEVPGQADLYTIRAAAGMILYLGRVYIWPIEHYQDDLALAIRRLEEAAIQPEIADYDEMKQLIAAEIDVLKGRKDRQHVVADESVELLKSYIH